MLKLNKTFSNASLPTPEPEWFEKLSSKKWKKSVFSVANLLLLISNIGFIVLLLVTLFTYPGLSLLIKILAGIAVTSFSLFAFLTVYERMKEKKSDKYSEIMK